MEGKTINLLIKRTILYGLVSYSIGFGFLHQIKVILRSRDAIFRKQPDMGENALHLKDSLIQKNGFETANRASFAFFTDRNQIPGGRDPEEFRYDVQYGFAPFLLYPGKTDADFFLLDFTDEKNLAQFIAAHGLRILESDRGLVLAAPERPGQ